MSRFAVGISAHFHDSACAILRDGMLVAAAQEERFTRVKETPAIPANAFRYCLRQAGASVADIACVGYYEDPSKKLERQLWTGLPQIPTLDLHAIGRLDATRPLRDISARIGYEGPVMCFDHHLSHAASSFAYSGFDEAALMTFDAVGEWATTTYGIGDGDGIRIFEEVLFPHSLGLFYSAVTAYLGFRVNSDEYKVMGLAAYGTPRFVNVLRDVLADGDDGQFALNQTFFDFIGGKQMYTPALGQALGRPGRQPDEPADSFAADVAHSAQVVLEEIVLTKAAYLRTRVKSHNLAVAGGVAHNCVAMGRLIREGGFSNVFIQPAAGDAGACLGAAVLADRCLTGTLSQRPLRDVYLGPDCTDRSLRRLLTRADVAYRQLGDLDQIVEEMALRLAEGQILGWCHGRMEFGPRALGNRSILADPRHAPMRDRLNALVKRREEFRPFAPAVVEESASVWFDLEGPSPYMLMTCQVRRPELLGAVTHIDGSARPQTVSAATAPLFHRLLLRFGALTGCPVLLNTSFNGRDEPIVCTAMDALYSFIRCGLDAVVIDGVMIERNAIPAAWRVQAERLYQATPVALHNVYTFI